MRATLRRAQWQWFDVKILEVTHINVVSLSLDKINFVQFQHFHVVIVGQIPSAGTQTKMITNGQNDVFYFKAFCPLAFSSHIRVYLGRLTIS